MPEPQIDVPANRVNGRMWQPGESGNPNGRPIGARGRFSQRFVADLTDAWEKRGAAALEQTAKLYPDRFVGICSHLIPKDVSVSLTAALPGNLEASDWTLILEVLSAVKRSNAGCGCSATRRGYVLCARRDPGPDRNDAKVIEGAE